MNKQSVKRRREEDDDDGSEINRLSQLPQPILHNILSLLSQKDAVQTSVLSKSWRYLWHGRLNVEFHDKYCFNGIKEFWHFFDKTLQRYLDQNLSLQKFLVEFQFVVDLVLLQKWIPVLIRIMCVKSLHLIFIWSRTIVFSLPLIFSQSESLVELHLKGLNLSTLKSTDNVMLNNLQTLRLHYVDITDEIFEKIISGCPLIENLDLLECTGLKSIKLHKHHKIKSFGCSMDEQTIIEIEDPHPLESVSIQNCRNWFLHHKNMHFPHLKSLKLRSVQLPAETFDNFSSFFPCLNELMLDSCHGLKEFLLFSSSIKRLTMKIDQRNRIKASIDTPNILYFEYTGDGFLPSIKFTPTSNEWASHISVWYKLKRSDKDATSWFLKLNKLLEALSQSHITLEVDGSNSKKLHIKDSYARFYKPVVVKHLKLSGCFLSSSDPTNLNCFLRICRPRYIHMDRNNDWQAKCNLVEYISKLIPDEKGCYFWLQDLEEVTFEVWDTKAGEWNCVQLTSLQALCCNIQHQIRFRLTWKEQ
ncbi:hypothetical protein CASFOL_021876 [Castilleja foliolosa]|uniref:F-box domain-containing protein n=1 Tax=Castilleja foliolosa TaxID=1961234 RepID=A0ABD3CZE3_9LAMI